MTIKMQRTKVALGLYLLSVLLLLSLGDAEALNPAQKVKSFLFSIKRLVKTDDRIKKVVAFDMIMLCLAAGMPYLVDGVLLNIATVVCGYFALLATALVVPMVSTKCQYNYAV